MQNDYRANPHKKRFHHYPSKRQQPPNAPRPPRSVTTYDFARDRAMRQMLQDPQIEIETPRSSRPMVKLAGSDNEFYQHSRRHAKPPRVRKPIPAQYIWWGLTLLLLVNFTAALVVDSRAFNKPAPGSQSVSSSATSSTTTTPSSTSVQAGPVLAVARADGKLVYTNEQFLFSLIYPATWAKVTAQTLNAQSSDTVKPLARIVFETSASDPLVPKKEIMRMRIDSTTKYVSLVEANKSNPTGMPTFIGKSGDNVISLETALPAPTSDGANSSTTAPPSTNNYTADLSTVLASFTATGANAVAPTASSSTPTTPTQSAPKTGKP